MEKRKPYRESIYYPYDLKVCPICGGAIKHPYTGHVTLEQLEVDSNTCQWMECVDENDYTLGYQPICRRIHPYTLESEDHKYVHYDIIEIVNSLDESIENRVKKLNSYIKYANPELKDEDFSIITRGERIAEVCLNKKIDLLGLSLGFDGKSVTVHRG